MAKDKKIPDKVDEVLNEEDAAAEKPKKKKGKLLIIIILLILAGGGGGGAWYFMQPKQPHSKEKVKTEAGKPPVFVTLEQFVVNLQSDGGDHYLQVGIDLQVSDEKTIEAVKLHMPQIRNSLLLLLSSKTATELATVEGKQKLSTEILVQTNKLLGTGEAGQGVTGALFTSFVIQ